MARTRKDAKDQVADEPVVEEQPVTDEPVDDETQALLDAQSAAAEPSPEVIDATTDNAPPEDPPLPSPGKCVQCGEMIEGGGAFVTDANGKVHHPEHYEA